MNDIDIENNHLFVVGVSNEGLLIFDLTDPENPDSVRTLLLDTGDESNIFAASNYVYIAEPDSSAFYIIDVSIPTIPILVSTTPVIKKDVIVSSNYADVTSNTGLTVYNKSDPTDLQESFSLLFSNARDIDISENYAFVASSRGNKIIDISDP